MSGFGMLTDTYTIPSKPKYKRVVLYVHACFLFSGSFLAVWRNEDVLGAFGPVRPGGGSQW